MFGRRYTSHFLLINPYVEVYDSLTREEITDLARIVARPVLFTVSVFDHADRDLQPIERFRHIDPGVAQLVDACVKLLQDEHGDGLVHVIVHRLPFTLEVSLQRRCLAGAANIGQALFPDVTAHTFVAFF
jgi:hypothetical protein